MRKMDSSEILHQYSESKFFSFFFDRKKYFQKTKKYFSENEKFLFKDFEFSSIKKNYNDFLIFQNCRFFDFSKFSIFQTKFSPRNVFIFCSDFFCWKAMGISFPTHLIRASESQFNTVGTVLKKTQLISGFFWKPPHM